jgi:hypothetical protein
MKLEDIPKKKLFDVPEGYFDALPQKIQARISSEKPERKPSFFFQYRLQYVIPVVVLLMAGVAWFAGDKDAKDAESILASVETQDLIAFLGESDLTTEDLLENGSFSSDDADEIETEVYELHLGDEGLDQILEDIDIENIDL